MTFGQASLVQTMSYEEQWRNTANDFYLGFPAYLLFEVYNGYFNSI